MFVAMIELDKYDPNILPPLNNDQNQITGIRMTFRKSAKDRFIKAISQCQNKISEARLQEQNKKNIEHRIDQLDKWQEELESDLKAIESTDTDFDSLIVETKQRVDKLEKKVKKSVNTDPLEEWKRETEEKIEDENYPYNGAGNGLDIESRERNTDAKPDDYDEKISQPGKLVRDSAGNLIEIK